MSEFVSMAGKLLIAPAAMNDPNFADAVTLLLVHTESGAFGVVLDRPLPVRLSEAVDLPDRWLNSADAPLWWGGPCETHRLVTIGRVEGCDAPVGFQPLGDRLAVLGSVDPDLASPESFRALRFFGGYAGWGPMQLDGELAADAWVVVDAYPSDAFDEDYDGLRGRVLRRALVPGPQRSHFPEDPSDN